MLVRRLPKLIALSAVAALTVGLAACEGGTGPGTTRFGQVGSVRLHVTTPLELSGSLEQVLVWESSGPWTVTERISYRGDFGDEYVHQVPIDQDTYASNYATFISTVNEAAGLELFVPELEPTVESCGEGRTAVLLVIEDETRATEQAWGRCTRSGTLDELQLQEAGPDGAAVRVIAAAILMRDLTTTRDFRSVFEGSVPFATIERGDDSNASLNSPAVFTDPEVWASFWSRHRGPSAVPPEVDFERDQVVLAAQGPRPELGDSIEVRRVLRGDRGSVAVLAERSPGDFCSPAAQTHTPYHLVRTPRTAQPVDFVILDVERVPCG